MASSFENKKELQFVITLVTGTFGSSSNNQITLEGFRASIDLDHGGGAMMGTLRARIYGVSQEDMNACTVIQWQPNYINNNRLDVYAIDGAQQTLVFSGNIVNSWGNYQNMPDVFLEIQAQVAYFHQLQAVAPTSYKGTVDAAQIINQLASQMGFTFENSNGLSFVLNNPYLPNTAIEQVKALAQMARMNWCIDGNILAITPLNKPRSLGQIPEISPQSGLISYPTFDGVGVNFQVEFNPALRFLGSFQLVTSVQRAQGQWIIASLSHKLESEKPGGAWFSTVRGNSSGLIVTN